MMSRMQKVVNSLEAWGKEIGLSFNALKNEVIMFSKATSIVKNLRAQINIYTECSKTDEQTGCCFTMNRNNTEIAADSIRLPDYTTVYQAEVLAIRLAMIEIRQHLGKEDRYIKIF